MHIDLERRKSQRFDYKSAILHSTNPPDFYYGGIMYNFSSGGLYFESDEDLLQEDEISISIQNPPPQMKKNPREYFDVRIKWCRVLQHASHQVGYGAQIL